ncbi:hypothetical protein ACWD5Z_30440 [Micromonospora chokoriensis]
MPVGLSIAASAEEMGFLANLAGSLRSVKVSERRPLDTAGDGLAFPLDAGIALQALEVMGIVAGSLEAMRQLLEGWRKIRGERTTPPSETSAQVFICDLRNNKVIYSGSELDAAVINAVLSRLDETADS